MASSKRRAQGGGRAANSEPRVQLFREFGGCNFELSPRDFTLGKEVDQEQSDLQMNFVVVQNNLSVTSNKTIETRNNLETLFTAPKDTVEGIEVQRHFTDACLLVGKEFYIGLDNGDLRYGDLESTADPRPLSNVSLTDNSEYAASNPHMWKSLAYADDKLIAASMDPDDALHPKHQLWTGNISGHAISNAVPVANPTENITLTKKGTLDFQVRNSATDALPYRISIAFAYINKFGPTAHSALKTIYANTPVEEWHGGCYLLVSGNAPANKNIEAVEVYYTTGNASSLLFAGRYDFPEKNGGAWNFSWFGNLDATNMWPVAQLIAPTQNYTEGVKASRMTCIDSRMYFWGDMDEPQRLYIGGNPGNLFSISPGTGGGFVDVEPGNGEDIRCVMKYKTQSGASIVTMLANSENSSKEQRFNLVENSVSLSNEQSMKSWQAEQVAGAVGCKSYNGAIVCEDGLYSVSRYGLALTTMTMEYNSQIRTNYVSDAIKPAFTDKNRSLLQNSAVIECDGIIYLAFGRDNESIDNMLFCYDIDQKAWWTVTLDIDEAILNMIHIDYEGYREGIGIVTANHVYLLPLTKDDSPETEATFDVVLQTGELSTTMPQQNWFYLSQMEFRFDYFLGSITIELVGIDQFGRKVSTKKTISHSNTEYDLAEYMRVDLRLQSYQIRITGTARFRMTHFMAKLYTMSSKQGLVWGFDDSQSFRTFGDIHPTFKDYNDIKKAIIP